jgi:hypothetical protein
VQKQGDNFEKNIFINGGKKACSNLGIDGVDLYGETCSCGKRA